MSKAKSEKIIDKRYRLGDEIGQGGMGTVYRAFDSTLEREVALKILSNGKLGTEGRSRLLAEAKTVAKLNHPNIVSVFDAGEYEKTPFIVMELVEGKTLRDLDSENMDVILEISKQICSALEHAHNQDIVHRDLKPENILIDKQGNAKLVDFGLARSVSSRLTSEGLIVGTVFYLAPEQVMGEKFDHRADLYSLGVLLYEMLTGFLPFEADDPVAVISQHLHAPVVPPKAKNPEIPGYLNSLVIKLLKKEPDERFTDAASVLKVLDNPQDNQHEGKGEHSALGRIVRGRMIGRKNELDQARALWKNTINGEGQALLISGEPGIGKTRLVREIVTHAEVSGGQSFVGASYAEGGVPYDAFAQIARKVLNRQSDNGHALPDFVLADVLELTPDLKPYFPTIQPNPSLSPEAQQNRLFENMVTMCKTLSSDSPLLLVIDDAHWSDSGTLHMLRHLIRRTRKHSVMLIATYREVELDEALPFHEVMLDLNRERLGARLKLSRLDLKQTEDLLAIIFSDAITPEFLDGIYKETEGNPFFIEEVCKALLESGKMYYENGKWHHPDIDELDIPQGVKIAIQSRVSMLPSASKDAVVAAAVIGREFDFSTLLKVIDADEDSLISAIEDATKAQLIEELRSKSGEVFSFSHALIPAALRETLGGLRRSRLHRRVAATLQELHPDNFELLAYHYSEAGDEEKGLEYTVKAAERAKESYANDEAVRFYTEALAVVPNDNLHRFSLLKGRADAFNMLARRELQVADINEMLSIAEKLNDDALKVDALVAQSDFFLRADKLKNLRLSAEEAVEIAEKLDDPIRQAKAYHQYAVALRFSGKLSKNQEYYRRAIDLFKQEAMPLEAANSMWSLAGSLASSNQVEAFIVAAAEGLDLSRQSGDPFSEAQSLVMVGFANYVQGNYQETLAYLEEADRIYRQVGAAQALCYHQLNTAFVHRILGQQEQNLSHLKLALDMVWDLDEPSALLIVLIDYSLYHYLYPGDLVAGLGFLTSQLSVAEETGNPNLVNMTRYALTHFKILIGQYESGIDDIDVIRSREVDMGEFMDWTFDLLLAWCQIGLGQFDNALKSMKAAFEPRIQTTESQGKRADMLGSLAWATLLLGDKSNYSDALDQTAQAIQAYQTGIINFLGRRGYCLAMDVRARLQLASDDIKAALETSQKLMDIVENEIIEISAPYFFTHSIVLRANDQAKQADSYLVRAYKRVTSLADKIKDRKIKTAWLDTNRQNHEIIAAYQASDLSDSNRK